MLTLDKVIRFRGTNENWEQKKQSGNWKNVIVFGKIYQNASYKYKIYAGIADTIDGAQSEEFEYNIATAEEFNNLVNRVNNIEDLININNGEFTNETFITAIENIIHNVTDNQFNVINSSINIINQAIIWHLEEDENV